MDMKAVIHVDIEEKGRLMLAIGNAENFLKAVKDSETDVRIVVNSSAVKLLRKAVSADYAQQAEALAQKGVRFMVCNNALSMFGINRTELLDFCEVVPAGIVELIRLQHEGFAYVKP